jgi:hypothetical protein
MKEMLSVRSVPGLYNEDYVIRHLPFSTPAEDISDVLVNLGFYVISVI